MVRLSVMKSPTPEETRNFPCHITTWSPRPGACWNMANTRTRMHSSVASLPWPMADLCQICPDYWFASRKIPTELIQVSVISTRISSGPGSGKLGVVDFLLCCALFGLSFQHGSEADHVGGAMYVSRSC